MFEFLRGSTSPGEFKTKLALLEKLFQGYIAGVETVDIIDTTHIANIYEHKKACNKPPSFIDLFLTAILKNLEGKNILLATFNHNDFPTVFLDRLIAPIDYGKEIENLCIYKFNKSKYTKAFRAFMKAKYYPKGRKRKKNK